MSMNRASILQQANIVVENYFQDTKAIAIEIVDPKIYLDHYVMNFSAEMIPLGQFNITRTEIVNELPRGLIVIIPRFEKWEGSANYEHDPSMITDGNGRVLRGQEPGYIASFLNRQFSKHGLAVLDCLTGCPKPQGLAIAKIFNFTGENYTHDVIIQEITRIEKEYKDNDLVLKVAFELRIALNKADLYFQKELSERADAILNNLCKTLDPQHRLMCRWTGLSAADFEISTQNQAMANQKLLMNMFAAAQQTQTSLNPTAPPPPAPEIPIMMELLKKTTEALNSQSRQTDELMKQNAAIAEQNKQMIKRVNELEKKAKSGGE